MPIIVGFIPFFVTTTATIDCRLLNFGAAITAPRDHQGRRSSRPSAGGHPDPA